MLIQQAINQYCTATHTPGVIRCTATKEAGCGSSTVLGWWGWAVRVSPLEKPQTQPPLPPSNTLYIIKTSRCLEASEGIEQIIESCVQTLHSTRQDVTSEDLHIFPSEKLPRKSNQGRNSLEKKKPSRSIEEQLEGANGEMRSGLMHAVEERRCRAARKEEPPFY